MKTLTMMLFSFFLFSPLLTAQTEFRVMSYNVENLFDTQDDPDKEDNEYLPEGNRRWTNGRYYQKLQQIAKVICAAGEWDTPALVGLCEVENDSVLIHLLNRTPLKQQHYRYCITHGEDIRGINTALLYQRDKFGYLGQTEYPILFTRKQHKQTRNILHVWGNLITGNILDVFVCHFPSRYGGEKESEQGRFDAASTLRRICDSLYRIRPTAQILIMGDFNDTPEDISIRQILAADLFPKRMHPFSEKDASSLEKGPTPTLRLYNLYADRHSLNNPGSHKYQGEWSQLDHIIVSGSLITTNASMRLLPESVRIFNSPFLLTPDKTWRGVRPKRTYHGFRYEGGYSDHLPLVADFLLSLPINQ